MGLFSTIGGIAGSIVGGPVGGAIGSGLGALGDGMGKEGAAPQVQGYAAMPQVVKDAYEQIYLPDLLSAYQDMRHQPMARVAPYDPNDIFASPELSALQMAADMKAGLMPPQQIMYQSGQPVLPTGAGNIPTNTAPSPGSGGLDPNMFAALFRAMNPGGPTPEMLGLDLPSYNTYNNLYSQQTLQELGPNASPEAVRRGIEDRFISDMFGKFLARERGA